MDLLVFEAARHAAPQMQGALVHQAKMQGVIESWCTENGIEYRGYSPGEIKKHALQGEKVAKGESKKRILELARKEFGDVADDNAADALWLLDLAKQDYLYT